MNGSEAGLRAELLSAGVPLSGELTEEQEQVALSTVGRAVLRELLAFLDEQTAISSAVIRMLVVEQVISPELSSVLSLGGQVLGIGVSPHLFERVPPEDPARALYGIFEAAGFAGKLVVLGNRGSLCTRWSIHLAGPA